MSALTVNHSCLKLQVCPGQTDNSPAEIMLYPKTPFVTISNTAKTTDKDISELQVLKYVGEVKNCVQVKGTVSKKFTPSYFIAVDQPELFAGSVFVDLLIKSKISINTTVALGKVPASSKLIAEHHSQPVSIIVQKMMKESDNLYADCLFKKIGQAHFKTRGSWVNGCSAVKEFLSSQGLCPRRWSS
jgi:D-alanyl-D-alanine carboxypeptidase/D-alanyl-D-alanine-endopeptidase (penicillin-binding protein 4)